MSLDAGPADARMTLRDIVDLLADRAPDAPFLIDPESGRVVNFRCFQDAVRGVATDLCRSGLGKGDKVAILLDNGVFTVELILGAMYGGFVPVPLSVVAGPGQLTHTLDHCDARLIFCASDYRSLLDSCIAHITRPIQIVHAEPDFDPGQKQNRDSALQLPAIGPLDDALVMYTSGSTGKARGVVFSHRNLLSGIGHTISVYGFSAQDRALSLLPLYHLNALVTTYLPMLLCGGSIVVARRFSVTRVWPSVAQYRCTWFAAVPSIVAQLVDREASLSLEVRKQIASMRFVRCSSAPLAPFLHHEFETRFHVLLVEGMGMTEAGEVLQTPPRRELRKVGSPGLPAHELQIVDAEGYPVSRGQTGEMHIRSPRVMQGYYKDPDATAEVLGSDGWLRTGDLARQDGDGYVTIVGRVKEVIIKGGVNIAPREIDDALIQHPDIQEVAVIGIPDHHFGEDLAAHVVLKPGIQPSAALEQSLLAHCARLLGAYKTPALILFEEDLPRGPSGKVQRLRLSGRYTDTARTKLPNGPLATPGSVTTEEPIAAALRHIWQDVLALRDVESDSSFFELGGDSLLATRVINRVRSYFAVELPLRALFEHPTVAGCAVIVEELLHALPLDTGD